jgi:hypothetical protein
VTAGEAAVDSAALADDLRSKGLGDDADEVARISKVAEDASHGNATPEELSKEVDDTKAEIARPRAEGQEEEAKALEGVLAKLEEAEEAAQAKLTMRMALRRKQLQ